MDYLAFGPYFLALVAYAASPGPLMAVLVARSLGNDAKGATAFAAGLCLGEVIAVVGVVLGIGLWAQAQPQLLALVKCLGVAYLLWLAVKMWGSRSSGASAKVERAGLLASASAGVALCLGNPATLLMQMLLIPIVAPEGVTSAGHMGFVILATSLAFGLVFFGTIPLARQLNRVIASPTSSVVVNRVTAGVIALTSIWLIA